MYTLNINLSDINKGIKDIEDYIKKLNIAIDNSLEEIKESLETKLLAETMMYGLDASELGKTAYVDKKNDSLEIGFTADYAEFVEYGTGIVGSQNPHPHPWAYNIGETIRPDGRWFYYKNGKVNVTRGLPARPIIYNTWLYGTRSATNRMKKHIRRIK